MAFTHDVCFRSILGFLCDHWLNHLLFKVETLKENYFSDKEKRTIDFMHQVEKFYSGHYQENTQIQSFPRYSPWCPLYQDSVWFVSVVRERRFRGTETAFSMWTKLAWYRNDLGITFYLSVCIIRILYSPKE